MYQELRFPDLPRNAVTEAIGNLYISYEETLVEKKESMTGNTRMV